MFDLEKSIADWRRQMQAAGIKTPVPLEELESHLREEIEQQVKSGLDGRRAFEIAAQQIGPPGALKKEFKKAHAMTNTCSINQRFSCGMLAIFSVVSVATLLLQFVTPVHDRANLVSRFHSGESSLFDLYATFSSGTPCMDFVRECSGLCLILTVLFAALSLRLLKQSRESREV